MAWQTPKTNWTPDDYFNAADLNRIENNSQEVANIIGSYSAKPTIIGPVTNRDNTSIEFADSMNRIESNILALKNASYQPNDWQTPKTNWIALDPFGYKDANRLEKNLLLLYTLTKSIAAYFQYCGNFYCGQNNTYL